MTGESGVGIRGATGVRGAPQDAGRKALERGDPGTLNAPDKEPAPPGSARLSPTLGVQGQPPAVQNQLLGQFQAAVGLQQAVEQCRVHCAPEPRAERECDCAPGVAARGWVRE